MDIDINDNEVLCFFNFRSPYAYVGIKKALELDIIPKFVPFCYVPKEILEAVTLNNPYKRDYLMEDCRRLFNELNIDLVNEIPADCNWPSVHAAWSEVNKEKQKAINQELNTAREKSRQVVADWVLKECAGKSTHQKFNEYQF